MHREAVLELIGARLQPFMQDPGDAGVACQVSAGACQVRAGVACHVRAVWGEHEPVPKEKCGE